MLKEEFEESLNNPIEYYSTKSKEQIKQLLGKDVSNMVGFNQRNPHHCFDLFMHTLNTINNLPKDASTLLRVAAFFHDIGKVYVAKEKEGRLVFYNHASYSNDIARTILPTLSYNEQEIEEICFYILHHDDFISWVLPKEDYNPNNEYLTVIHQDNFNKYRNNLKKKTSIQVTDDLLKNLLFLCLSDVTSQSDVAMQNGKIVGTKKIKQSRILELMHCLEN